MKPQPVNGQKILKPKRPHFVALDDTGRPVGERVGAEVLDPDGTGARVGAEVFVPAAGARTGAAVFVPDGTGTRVGAEVPVGPSTCNKPHDTRVPLLECTTNGRSL